MPITSKEIVDKVKDLLPMPEVSIAITDRMADDSASISDIAEILKMDPVLSAKLVSIANSPYYAYQGKIDDLNRAVMLVGMNGVRELVWACESIRQFSQSGLPKNILDEFWNHSLFVAMAAKTLATKCKAPFAERVFLTGLLHDIGLLVMFQAVPSRMQWVWDVAKQQGMSLIECERREIGIDHYAVGAEFLKQWGIPDQIVNVVRLQGSLEPVTTTESAITNIATHVAYNANFSYGLPVSLMPAKVSAWQTVGLSEKIVEAIQKITLDSFNETKRSFLGAQREMAA